MENNISGNFYTISDICQEKSVYYKKIDNVLYRQESSTSPFSFWDEEDKKWILFSEEYDSNSYQAVYPTDYYEYNNEIYAKQSDGTLSIFDKNTAIYGDALASVSGGLIGGINNYIYFYRFYYGRAIIRYNIDDKSESTISVSNITNLAKIAYINCIVAHDNYFYYVTNNILYRINIDNLFEGNGSEEEIANLSEYTMFGCTLCLLQDNIYIFPILTNLTCDKLNSSYRFVYSITEEQLYTVQDMSIKKLQNNFTIVYSGSVVERKILLIPYVIGTRIHLTWSLNSSSATTASHYIIEVNNVTTTKIFYVTKDGEAFYGGGINVNNKFIVDKEGNVSLPPGTKISWADVEGTDNIATSDQVSDQISDQVASMEQTIMTEIGDTYVKTNEIEANIANLGGWEISSSGFKSADFDKVTNTNGIRLDSNGEIRSKGSWYSSVDGSGVEGWFARLYSGKWIFGYYDSTQSDPFIPPADTPYSDISVNGIYMCSKDTILNKSSQYLFAVDTTRDVVSITSSSSNPALTITNNSEGTCLEIKNNSCTYDNKALSLGVTVVNTDDEGNTSSGMGYITVFGEGESNASRIIMRPDQNIKSTDTTNPANYTNSACGTYYYPWGTMSCVQLYADKTSTTSDAKLKTPINLIDSDTALEFINGLTPREYYFNDSKNKRHHMGFYAQEVSQLAKELNLGDMAIYEAITSKDNDETEYYYDENVDDEHLHWSLNYNEFIAPLVSAVQGLTKKIENLEAENEKLRTRIEKLEDVSE